MEAEEEGGLRGAEEEEEKDGSAEGIQEQPRNCEHCRRDVQKKKKKKKEEGDGEEEKEGRKKGRRRRERKTCAIKYPTS